MHLRTQTQSNTYTHTQSNGIRCEDIYWTSLYYLTKADKLMKGWTQAKYPTDRDN